MHWERWQTTGDPLTIGRLSSPEERFWAKVDKRGKCWLWTACTDKDGYGKWAAFRGESPRPVHRVAYEWLVGPIPEGLVIDHLCRVKACVNPKHLEVVTPKVNTNRGVNHERAKTHCPQGHPYSGDNLIVRRRGWRECRTCVRVQAVEASRRYRARHG